MTGEFCVRLQLKFKYGPQIGFLILISFSYFSLAKTMKLKIEQPLNIKMNDLETHLSISTVLALANMTLEGI